MSETQGFKKELRPIDVWGLALGANCWMGLFCAAGKCVSAKIRTAGYGNRYVNWCQYCNSY